MEGCDDGMGRVREINFGSVRIRGGKKAKQKPQIRPEAAQLCNIPVICVAVITYPTMTAMNYSNIASSPTIMIRVSNPTTTSATLLPTFRDLRGYEVLPAYHSTSPSSHPCWSTGHAEMAALGAALCACNIWVYLVRSFVNPTPEVLHALKMCDRHAAPSSSTTIYCHQSARLTKQRRSKHEPHHSSCMEAAVTPSSVSPSHFDATKKMLAMLQQNKSIAVAATTATATATATSSRG